MTKPLQKTPALTVDRLVKTFDVSAPWLNRVVERKPRQYLQAVNDISFTVPAGGCLSIVGESGCGKSTVARLVTGLHRPTSGEMRFAPGRSGAPLSAQMIFQDPYASLNPRWRVKNIIAEPLRELKLRKTAAEVTERVEELLGIVGLSPSDGEKFPHEFSGGQRQRISIARALASEPEFLVCDEPTSALDVSVQAQVLNLMRRLQDELGLTYLFISHDLSVVRQMSDRIAVMYLGRIVEEGDTEELFAQPRHPYTRLLLQTIPNIEAPNRNREPASGEVPSPLKPPSGCAFHPRCPIATARCSKEVPTVRVLQNGTRVACHLAEDVIAERLPEAG
ncbi:MAG: ABC transporter ATP-binding protein [Sinorhizobium meliloti]|jgi:peptide/nickel transport system ATP-binding protein|uniref:ABC transporter ATP-binding protein n=1 Tax=Rhizobium meliloti TaxID=382 RepID=A0A2J0Z4V2_RHIML|nr:ABC transporter ATP-binding protein [Sinorhizobium meliloti]GCA51606.1 putative D,D-dipeptide transport ATP-binding protein DdpF [Sinorhizobium sp. KGO-5]MCG5482088.1 ABC transporter ATP-binding protein [Sinorhizobium meliloti]PJR15525.1 ABC transporter ATP-binding protein [Sinorhizobium meliloti]RVP95808.1 ABC transporter ATP-binding protein [Sinorhizobium meliloti]WRQ66933.1 ABC transporter ATP-binding protein [Sinorhizobium meliloti]